MKTTTTIRRGRGSTHGAYECYGCVASCVAIVDCETRDALVARVQELEAAAHDLLWLNSNRHNYGGKGWLEYFDAAVKDAERALDPQATEETP